MRVGSLFAGVGGFDIAAERAGMEVVWQSEVDKHASKVLEHYWPGLNKGDIHGVGSTDGVDVLVGGFPCQDYSVAGARAGLAGDRGALWWEFHRLIAEGRPKWVVGENVPGLISSRGGRDFATIIDSLAELGYTVGWRVLDSQWFGVPQRRRRVFIVGHLGDGSPAEVLALAQSMSGDPKPSRTQEQDPADSLETRPTSDRLRFANGHLVGHQIQGEVIGREGGPNGDGITSIEDDPAYTLNIAGGIQAVAFNANQDPNATEELAPPLISGGHSANDIGVVTARKLGFGDFVEDDTASTVTARDYKSHTDLIAFTQNQRDEVRELEIPGALAAEPGMKQFTYLAFSSKDHGGDAQEDLSPTVRAGSHDASHINGGVPPAIAYDEFNDETGEVHHTLHAGTKQSTGVITHIVRRLTPLECERLQGFPDNWTNLPQSDSQRYKQMGNAVTVNTVEWILRRIAEQ